HPSATAGGVAGNSFHSCPSSDRQPDFGRRPPHCLKKNATLWISHCLRISRTHCGRISLAPGPLSPPTITQSIPLSSIPPREEIRGSIDKNLSPAGESRKWVIRLFAWASSTDTPHQM